MRPLPYDADIGVKVLCRSTVRRRVAETVTVPRCGRAASLTVTNGRATGREADGRGHDDIRTDRGVIDYGGEPP